MAITDFWIMATFFHFAPVCNRIHCVQEKFDFRLEAKQIWIGRKRKAGRPQATKGALQFQYEKYAFSDSGENDEQLVTPKES